MEKRDVEAGIYRGRELKGIGLENGLRRCRERRGRGRGSEVKLGVGVERG